MQKHFGNNFFPSSINTRKRLYISTLLKAFNNFELTSRYPLKTSKNNASLYLKIKKSDELKLSVLQVFLI